MKQKPMRLLPATLSHFFVFIIFGGLLAFSGCGAGDSENSARLGPVDQLTLEVNTDDLLRNLSSNPQDSLFARALTAARQAHGDALGQLPTHLLTALEEEYTRIGRPKENVRLIDYFLKYDSGLPTQASNEEVLAFLDEKVRKSIEQTFTVLQKRIDGLGVSQPSLEKDEKTARIVVEFAGGNGLMDRVIDMIKRSGELGFWETYTYREAYPVLLRLDSVVDVLRPLDTTYAEAPVAEAEKEKPSALDEIFSEGGVPEKSVAEQIEEYRATHPFTKLFDLTYALDPAQPVVGRVAAADTAKVNYWLEQPEAQAVIPANVKFMWDLKTSSVQGSKGSTGPFVGLVCIKSGEQGQPRISGEVITMARMDFMENTTEPIVNMEMNTQGEGAWRRMTRDNVGKAVAIVLDGRVYTRPTVMEEISSGLSQIAGQFTIEEAKDLATILQSGPLPAMVTIAEIKTLTP